MTGTCEMCGAEGRQLRMLYLGDDAWRVCPECMGELEKSQARRYCSAGEETEPGE